jgi:glycosyltransferase A (GT-A) superfamily protein (DUF2064 family)
MTWKELETLWDIDRPEDYARLEREGCWGAMPAEAAPPARSR